MLTVSVSPEESGKIFVPEQDGKIFTPEQEMETDYPYAFSTASTLQLHAVADPGYRFFCWQGDLSGDDNPAPITVNCPREVTALFVPVQDFTAWTEAHLEVGALEGTITDLQALDPGDDADAPEDLRYGLIDLEIEVDSPGDRAAIVIYLAEAAPQNYKFFKYDDARGWFDFSREVISGGTGDGAEFNSARTVATIHITDNGDYDTNPAERYIHDPLGLGISASDVSSPGEDGGGGCFINTLGGGRYAPR